jgi:hypothetical protein
VEKPVAPGSVLSGNQQPAERMNVGFEPGLVERILDDVEKRPGGLPLLQFALREMWFHIKVPLMTREDYDTIGGVEGALAQRAQAILDASTDHGQDGATAELFRRLFTRLVTLGEGAEDTRRIVGRHELGPDTWALAQRLAGEDNRLVVTTLPRAGEETAEVVHEALIRNWPALVDWVQRDRAFQSWLRQLLPRVDDWLSNPTDEGTLLRGGPLAVAEEWVVRRGGELSKHENEYIQCSVDARDAAFALIEEERKRELARQAELLDSATRLAHEQEIRANAERGLAEKERQTARIERERIRAQNDIVFEEQRRLFLRRLFIISIGCVCVIGALAYFAFRASITTNTEMSKFKAMDANLLATLSEN